MLFKEHPANLLSFCNRDIYISNVSEMHVRPYHEKCLNINYINAWYITFTPLHQYQFGITRFCRLLLAKTVSIK